MAPFKQMFKRFLGFEDVEIAEEAPRVEPIVPNNPKKDKIRDFVNQLDVAEFQTPKELTLYPNSFADACEVVEHLAQGDVVVVDMDEMDLETCKRISDFVLGAIFVLEGDVEKLSKKVFRFWVNK